MKAVLHCDAQGNGDRGAVQEDKSSFRFSTAVFASWDYHLTDYKAAANLRRSLRQQLRELLNDATDEDNYAARVAAWKGILRKVHPFRITIQALLD